MEAKGRGRPRKEGAPVGRRAIRVYPADDAEMDAVHAAARESKQTVSAWVLALIRKALRGG